MNNGNPATPNQPPAGYIWPPGYYPMHGNNHSANLLAAENYVKAQEMRARGREESIRYAQEHPVGAFWTRVVLGIIVMICIIVGFLS